jgi:NAD-dependent SIR2 family protein deacetylase
MIPKYDGTKKIIIFSGAGISAESGIHTFREMYRAFEATKHKESIMVIIGTMGNVINVEGHLDHTLCKKILNNLEASEYINDDMFDKVYYEKETVALAKIEDINNYWKN